MTRRYILLLVVNVLLISCNKTKTNNISTPEPIIEQEEVVPAPEEPSVVVPDVPLGFLVTYKGKYAAREKLFEEERFSHRLKQLPRFNYKLLLQNYNTETPVVIKDNIVHMSGCKQHDCPSSAYDFFIDLDNDNINIYHFRSNMLRLYNEKELISLPPDFAAEMETKKINAGIGNTESIESNYKLQ